MTKDAWVSLLVKVLLMVLTPLAAQLHINDGATISAFATDLADIIVLGFGVYQQWNMKRVPQASVAIEPHSVVGAPVVGTTVGLPSSAKVVGALLVAFALSFLAFPHNASAQTGNIIKDIATARAKTAAPKAASVAPSTATAPKTQTVANPLAVIQAFTEADLTAALADATANKDAAAISCYTALLPIVQSGVANPLPTTLGGFELLQKARDLQSMLASLQSPNGPLSQLNIACAPLVLSVQNTLVLLGVVGGGVALTGGAGGLALPGLGALIPAL